MPSTSTAKDRAVVDTDRLTTAVSVRNNHSPGPGPGVTGLEFGGRGEKNVLSARRERNFPC